MKRNPIIKIGSTNIQTIGDVHLGRTFKTGVPSSKLGIREEMVFQEFDSLLNPKPKLNISYVVMMGDIFDKFIVSPKVVLRTYEIISKACSDNPSIHYYLLPGNHDLSRDKTKVSSYVLLSLLLEDIPNLDVIVDKPLIKRIDSFNVIYLDAYNPFHKDSEEVSVFEDYTSSDIISSFGHWDDVTNEFGHYFPSTEVKERSSLIVSGHIHTPKEFDLNGSKYIYTGSMQPYSHAEDPEGILYTTINYSTLEAILETNRTKNIEDLKTKNIRISCYPGYVFPSSIDCLSLTYLNNLTEESLLEISKPVNTISDFTTLYLHTLKEDYNMDMDTLLKINDFLKDSNNNVHFTLD